MRVRLWRWKMEMHLGPVFVMKRVLRADLTWTPARWCCPYQHVSLGGEEKTINQIRRQNVAKAEVKGCGGAGEGAVLVLHLHTSCRADSSAKKKKRYCDRLWVKDCLLWLLSHTGASHMFYRLALFLPSHTFTFQTRWWWWWCLLSPALWSHHHFHFSLNK